MSLYNKSLHITNNLQWFLVGEITTGQFKKQRLCAYLPASNMLLLRNDRPLFYKLYVTLIVKLIVALSIIISRQ